MAVSNTDLVAKLDELSVYKTTTEVKTRGSSELGKEEFLKLLVCQLQNQDPLNPESDTEFIAQLAQFSALEQMTNMSTTLTNTSAYGLVGKEVIVGTTDSAGRSTEVRGTVDYVQMQNGEAKLSVNGVLYSMDDLIQVMDSFYAIQEYLPSVEAQEIVLDQAAPSLVEVKIDLGSNGYEASSVAVALGGAYIDSSYMSYDPDTGILTISPAAFDTVFPGEYDLAFYFDDLYNTSVTDKVTVKVINTNGTAMSGTTGSTDSTTDDSTVDGTDNQDDGSTEEA